MIITLIVAMDKNGAIGKDGALPWHCREDLEWFRRHTEGKVVIMGRKTFESIGHPLPNRSTIIVTRNPNYQYQPGSLVARTLEDALRWASLTPTDEIMVAGGGEIYQQTLPHAKRVLMTKFDHVVQGADTYFPTLEESEWVESKIKDGETSQPELPFSFWEYNRRG